MPINDWCSRYGVSPYHLKQIKIGRTQDLPSQTYHLRLSRDGTGRPNSSDETNFSGANGDKEILIFPVQLTTSGWRELVPSGPSVCRCHVLSFFGVTLVLFCFVFVFLLSLKPLPFVQMFFVLRYSCAPTATRSYLTIVCVFFCFCFYFFFFLWRCRFFRILLLYPTLLFSLINSMESTSYVFPFRMVFFYLVTTGWIFHISIIICGNSFNQSIIIIIRSNRGTLLR